MPAKIPESVRLQKITEIESEYWQQGIVLAGMDEVGRGPLAGPVVTAAVILPSAPLIERVNDSKKLSEARRAALYPQIKQQAIAVGTGWVEPNVIDELNILNATKLAFSIAFKNMNHESCTHVLVDAVKGLDIPAVQHAIIHGDALSYLIAAASIIAKQDRDEYMKKMHELYPYYRFDKNKGYGTAEHIAALKEYGPCPIHRQSFIKGIIK